MPTNKIDQPDNSCKYLESDILALYYNAKELSKEEFIKKLHTEFCIFYEILYKKMHTCLLYLAHYYRNVQLDFDFEDVLHNFMIQELPAIFKTFNPYWNPKRSSCQNLFNYLKVVIKKKYTRAVYIYLKKAKFENESILETLIVTENNIAIDTLEDIKQCLRKKSILL